MNISTEHLGVILRHACWMERHASQIAEAFEAGHGPGEHTDAASADLHRQIGSVYQMTLSPHYLRLVADSFWRCSDLMAAMSPDEPAIDSWNTVSCYLQGVSETVSSGLNHSQPNGDSEFNDNTMELLRYEKLATLMRPELVGALHNAATAVADYCRFFTPLAPNDTQLACLKALAAGQNQDDIAKNLGYSKRHIQRILADMWDQFGVDTAPQGLAFAAAQEWVTVPPNTA